MPWLLSSLFSESAFEEFLRKNEEVVSERDIMRTIFPIGTLLEHGKSNNVGA
jgi:hypothetical protein